LAKRGEGRFSEQYVYSIMDSLVNEKGEGRYLWGGDALIPIAG